MQIYDFVERELQMFREECNFTEEELEYFNLRAKGKSNVEISLKMSISTAKVSILARRVKKKKYKEKYIQELTDFGH